MMPRIITLILMITILALAGCSVIMPGGGAQEGDESARETFAPDDSYAGRFPGIASHGDELAIQRALAARMLVMAFYDREQIDALPWILADYSPERWYGRYINALHHMGYGAASGIDSFRPYDFVTLSQAQEFLDALNDSNTVRFQVDESNHDLHISYALWNDLFQRFLLQDAQSGPDALSISRENLTVLATWRDTPQLAQWETLTDRGRFIHTGIELDVYVDMRIGALVIGDELLAVLEVESQTPVIHYAYIADINNSTLTIHSGGATRSYALDPGARPGSGARIAPGTLAHVTISAGYALSIEAPGEPFRSKILRKTGSELDLLNLGTLRIDGGLRVFSTADGFIEELSATQLYVGMDQIDFYMNADGAPAAALIREWPTGENIRVAISTSGFAGLVHTGVSLRSQTGATLSNGRDVRNFAPNEEFHIDSGMFGYSNRVFVAPHEPGSMLQITSVTRHGGVNPSYLGHLEISIADGGYKIVNALSMDEYLWGVVPSEMPTAFGEEAAKVQAITARSYAYNQLFTNRFAFAGANVCDSVNSQVYNNIAKTPLSIAAVNATSGMFLVYDDHPVSANYFSASSGHTANSGEVWARGDEFPSHTPTYLRSVRQHDGAPVDMRVEKNARAFFQDLSVRALDMNHPWFRWNTELTAQEIAASVNANLSARYNANPSLIRTLQPDGSYVSVPIDSIGELRDLEVTMRGEGGNIMEMRISGSLATILVQTEFNVRSLIQARQFLPGGRDIVVRRHDGTTAVNHGMMPSAFYSMMRMTYDDGSLSSVRFYGGGSGHGAGMSHAGVRGMTEAGAGFEDILRHFYFGAVLENR